MSCSTVIDTKKITNITTSSLQTGGINLISAEPIVEKGVVYSYTNFFPTIAHDRVICPNKGVGKFNITLTGLSEGFTYYVRAYAINNKGEIAYGKTLEAKMLVTAGGSCSMIVTLSPGKIYTVPTGYELTGSTSNSSLSSSCIDTTKLQNLKLECFTTRFQTNHDADVGYSAIFITGFNIQGVLYPFNTPLMISTPGDFSVSLQTQISADPYLSNIIYNICGNAYDVNDYVNAFIVTFKTFSNLTKDSDGNVISYLTIRTFESSVDGNTIPYDCPIIPRNQLSDITQCPCTT